MKLEYIVVYEKINKIIGVFCYKFKSQTNILASLAHAQEFTLLINCAESLRHSNVYIIYL